MKIYQSGDNGAVWHECGKAGHRYPTTSDVALDPHHPGSFWVATNGRSYARFTPGACGAWQQQNFSELELNDPLVSGINADPDGDALVNQLEYAFTLDPHLQSQGNPRLVAGAGALPDFRFHRNPLASDISYRIRSSPDLTTWTRRHTISGTTALPSAFAPDITLIADPATQDVTYRTNSTLEKEFFRVEVSPNP